MTHIQDFMNMETRKFIDDCKDPTLLPDNVLALIMRGWVPPAVFRDAPEVHEAIRRVKAHAARKGMRCDS